MAREEDKGQEPYGRETGENETKNRITVLTLSPPQLIVNNNQWPHLDWGHGVVRRPGEEGRVNSGGAAETWKARTARLLCSLCVTTKEAAWPAHFPCSGG